MVNKIHEIIIRNSSRSEKLDKVAIVALPISAAKELLSTGRLVSSDEIKAKAVYHSTAEYQEFQQNINIANERFPEIEKNLLLLKEPIALITSICMTPIINAAGHSDENSLRAQLEQLV